jgi:hypothetical protein
VRQLGEGAGIRARPHGLRYAAITEALDLTGGDVRKVQRFSLHRNLNTLQRYDDNWQDLAGDVARRLAEAGGDEAAAARCRSTRNTCGRGFLSRGRALRTGLHIRRDRVGGTIQRRITAGKTPGRPQFPARCYLPVSRRWV